jgi:hypothetical protein
MNNLNQYINEKLKIGSNSKVNQKTKPANEEDLKKIILKKIENKETDFNDIDISAVKDLSHLFEDQDISEIDISEWDVSHVESMRAMFQNCRYLKTCGDLGKWNVGNVLDMSWMFNGCQCLKNIGDLDNWEINGTKMKCAFQGCKRLKSVGFIEHWRPEDSNYDIFAGSDVRIQPRKRV